MEAVYGLCGVDRGIPEVWGSVYDVRELLASSVKLMDGKSPDVYKRQAIKDASFPAPFASKLEYNSPVHGNWNIVHTGMQVPESIQIYVCAENCMRGVVLTAAEMNASDRFSYVIVEQKDVLYSNLDDLTIEGVTDVLSKRGDLSLIHIFCYP